MKLTEAQIAQQITQLLELDNWRAVKMEPLSGRGVASRIIGALKKLPLQPHMGMIETTIRKATQNRGAGEEGMPDCLYLRYRGTPCRGLGCSGGNCGPENWARVQALWIEHKAPGGKVQQHQKDWHAAERARGALVLLAGVDFECSAEGFLKWYAASGLQRNKITL